mgnify:CR=1 FL=1
MLRKFSLLLLGLIIIFAFIAIGCSKNEKASTIDSTKGNLIVIDSVGRKINLKKPVSRAVIMNAYNAELINAIGAMDQVVGVDYYIYQDQDGFKHRFTKEMLIGQSKGSDLNYEKIIELKPEAVIMTSNYHWQDAEKNLKPFGI